MFSHNRSIYRTVDANLYRSSNCQRAVMRHRIAAVDEVNETRRSQLLRLMGERFNDSQAELGRALRRSPTTVWRWISRGKHEKPIGEKVAREIEQQLNLPAYWLDGVAQVMLPSLAGVDVLSTKAHQLQLRAVPLLSAETALKYFTGQSAATAERIGVVYSSKEDAGPNTVALLVRLAANEPEYTVGDRIFVDPDVLPAPGDMVLALVNGIELVLRKLRMLTADGKRFELLARDPNFPAISSDTDQVRICGVCIEHHRYRHAGGGGF